MSSNLTATFNGTFAQRQEDVSSLKDYRIMADFDGLLVAIDLNHPVNLYVSDLPNGRRTGISVTGRSYDIDGFKGGLGDSSGHTKIKATQCLPLLV